MESEKYEARNPKPETNTNDQNSNDQNSGSNSEGYRVFCLSALFGSLEHSDVEFVSARPGATKHATLIVSLTATESRCAKYFAG
jgi:hypothetical protein